MSIRLEGPSVKEKQRQANFFFYKFDIFINSRDMMEHYYFRLPFELPQNFRNM